MADVWHVGWLVPVLSFLVGVGAISGVFAWLGSPCQGLLATADDGELPPALQQTNTHGMPTTILLVQGAVVTVMSFLYFVIRDVSVVFFLISAMTIALYLIAYMFMYAAAIKLRYSRPTLPRPFSVPGGLPGMWLTAGIGLVGVGFSFLVAFFPPDQLPMGSPGLYVALVVIGTVFFCGIPLVIHGMRRTEWVRLQPKLLPAE